MSERVSLTKSELACLWTLISEAREVWDEDATRDERRVADSAQAKIGRAFHRAQRKAGNSQSQPGE